ncbi:MarR family winged helix-turn-helix transcriptional regulator [Pseudomonas aeruginosa]|uniref:MarR family winged helix-turn-helix transcriptional regulator n=1 Tax=Pseudomonas aeruginosa TaxID=287 RepID=UPI00057A2970|nr:MarR family transcriptional regulator [Pseudomonas aeruginosa]MBG6711608.1 MarR family transcriptional regulator [Pseudomonas aeruginosa]HEJ1606697.1 MarR family transcriptional regulator [Pseudomonas aeruginosa]HEJ5500795.1 MarR family transcriptional regulator [Pseudomonas aeruginosa]
MPTNQDLQLAAHLRSQVTTLTRRLRREAQADPVQFSQLVVLGAIDRLGGDVTPSELAAAERMRSSNLAALLRELERGGLIVRHADPQDGRRTRVSLSSEGRRNLYGNRVKREEWLVRAMYACLDESERALLAAAGPLLTRLAQFEEP